MTVPSTRIVSSLGLATVHHRGLGARARHAEVRRGDPEGYIRKGPRGKSGPGKSGVPGGGAHVVVVGQGYVGLPVAMRAVEAGFRVTGYDAPTRPVALTRPGRSYVEDVPADQVAAALEAGLRRHRPRRPRRLRHRRRGDLGADAAARRCPRPLVRRVRGGRAGRASPRARSSCSSRPPTRARPRSCCGRSSSESGLRAGVDFFLGYSPERIDPGNPTWTFENTPKVVSGIDAASLRGVEAFYGTLVDKVVPVGSTAEAELVKLLENTFRHVNIALVNELAMFAGDLGVDIWPAIDAASTKPFGYMRFTPDPASAATACRSTRRTSRGGCKRRSASPSGSSSSPTTSTSTCPTTSCAGSPALLNRARPRGARHPHPAARHRVQGRHLGLARVAVDRGRRAARRARRRPAACDPHIPRRRSPGLELQLVDFSPRRLAMPTSSCCSSTTRSSIRTRSAATPPLVFDAKGVLRGRTFDGEPL